jgi:quercetin dioxygenase-like cupin family protein
MAKPLFATDETQHANLVTLADIVGDAIVSKPLVDTGPLKQILFSMDAGQEISEHKAPFPAMVHVLTGRLRFGIGGETREMSPHDWVMMKPGEMHDLTALEPTRFLLTLIKGA